MTATANGGGRRGARLLDRVFVRAAVEAAEPAGGRMLAITLRGAALRGLAWTPGQQIRVNVADLLSPGTWLHGLRDARRTYSVWNLDPGGVLELRVMDHEGDGPGARWARGLRPGREVTFSKPEGGFVLRPDAPYHLFAGEETASVAFGAMLRALPASARVYGAVETATAQDRLPLPRSGDLAWVERGAASAAGSAALLEAVRALDLPDEPGAAYLAGEARTVQAVKAHLLRERGWPRGAVRTKPFWTPGKKGLE